MVGETPIRSAHADLIRVARGLELFFALGYVTNTLHPTGKTSAMAHVTRPSRILAAALLGIGMLASLGTPVTAASITTTFAGGNSFAGNMFDVTTFASPLTVTGLEVNIDGTPGTSISIDVYTRSGTYAGHESSSLGWTLVASGSALSAATNSPTAVDISDFILSAAGVTGVYVTLNPAPTFGVSTQLAYTNGTNSYANADLQLDLGVGIGGLFAADGVFSPRTWNGTIIYEVGAANVPEPASLALFATGLVGLALRRRRG